jgi:hypothetical protein
MRRELQTVELRYRCGHKLNCYFCWGRFPEGAALANAISDDGEMFCGHVCPKCIAHGEEWLERRLESNAEWAREEAEEQEELSLEGVTEIPTLEEFRLFERITALD